MLSACKKDAVKKPTGPGKTSITFALGFTQSTGGFNGAANITKSKFGPHTLAVDTSLTKYASVIYVGVYASDGTQLFLTKQLSTDTVFGKVNYNLSPGNYTVTFAAGQSGMIEADGNKLSGAAFWYQDGPPRQPYIWKNSFFQKINLTVGNTAINQTVNLKRIDSQIIVNIEDAVPANAKFIFFGVLDNQSEPSIQSAFSIGTGSYRTGSSMGYLFTNTPLDTALTPGTKNIKLMIPVLGDSKPFSVAIYAFDKLPPPTYEGNPYTGNIIASAFITNVNVQAGHQTILSGKLFGGNGLTDTGGFRMTVDPQWGTPTTTIPFQ